MGQIKKLVLATIAATSLLCATSISTRADTVPYDRQLILTKASSTDDVGIAFLKMSNNFPDFNVVVENSATYKKLDPLAQKDYKTKEVAKLQASFLEFSPKKTPLVIRVGVKALYNRAKDGTATLDIVPPSQGQLYFPFYFANYPIAMIVDGIELFQHIDLTKEEAAIVYSTLGLDGAATLLLQVYPVAADDKKHIMLDKIPQYPLLSEIGYIGLINTRAEQIWAWGSPKYKKGRTKLPTDGTGNAFINLAPDPKK